MEGVAPRGLLARRPPGARQPHRRLRRQPDLDRGRHRHLVQRGRRQALRGLRLGRRRRRLARTDADGATATSRTSTRCSPRSARGEQGHRQADPRRACTRSSRGPPRRSRTPASRTARPSATTRSPPPRSCSASTRRSPSPSSPPSSRTPARSSKRGKAAHREWDKRHTRRGARPTPSARTLLDRLVAGQAARRARRRRCRPSRPTRRAWRRAPRPARCSRALRRRHARAVGRLGRPRRVQQHDDGGRAVVHPRGQADPRVEGRPLRAHPALRHPRERDGHDPQRDRARGPDPPLRRHVPRLLRLHAPRRAAGRHPAGARSPSCGRTTPSASARTARPTSRSSTSPPCAPSRAWTSSARRRQRDGGRRGPRSSTPATPGRRWPDPPEPVPTCDRKSTPRRRGVAKGAYVLVEARVPVTPDVVLIATGSEVQLAVEAARAPREGRHRDPRRLDAVPGVVRGADPLLPGQGPAAVGPGPRQRRGGRRDGLARPRRRRRAHASASSTSAPRRTTRPCSASSGSPPRRSSRPPRTPSRPPRAPPPRHRGHRDVNPARAAQSASTDVKGADGTGSGNAARAAAAVRHEPGEVTSMTNTDTQALSDARRLHLARRPVPRAHRLRQPRGAHHASATSSGSPPTRRSSRPPCPRASAYDDAARRADRRPARTSTEAVFALTTADVRRRLRRLPARSTSRPTASTAACRSRSTRGSRTTPTRPSSRPSSCRPPSTARTCSSRSRPPGRGLPAITAAIAEGISVNVTLIFSLERYRAVMNAYLDGPREGAREPATTCRRSTRSPRSSSPAWTPRSTSGSTPSAPTRPAALKGKAGVANARLAYQAFEEVFSTPRWALAGRGRRQRAAPAVGVDRRQGPGLPRHDVRHRARRPRHRQHDARRRPSRPPPTTARSTATP